MPKMVYYKRIVWIVSSRGEIVISRLNNGQRRYTYTRQRKDKLNSICQTLFREGRANPDFTFEQAWGIDPISEVYYE